MIFLLMAVATSAKTIKVGGQYGWTIGADLDPIQASVGDSLLFDYFYIHDVQEMTGDNCEFSSATLLGGSFESPFTLQLTVPGTHWYSCSTGDHCQRGQTVQVIVTANEDEEDGALEEQGVDYDIDEARQAMCLPSRCDTTFLQPLIASARDTEKVTSLIVQACRDVASVECRGIVQALYGCQDQTKPDSPEGFFFSMLLKQLTDSIEKLFGFRGDRGDRVDKGLLDEFTKLNGDGLSEEERLNLNLPADPRAKPTGTKPVVEATISPPDMALKDSNCTAPAPVDGQPDFLAVTCWSSPLSMFPGQVIDVIKAIPSPFPSDRPVAIMHINANIVDENKKEVSLREVYVHHILGTLKVGAGAEDIRTPLERFPEPYVWINNPRTTADVTNLHLINTVGVSDDDLLPCIECMCPEGFATENGDDGGVICCSDCNSSFPPESKTYFLQYSVQYRDIIDQDIPVREFLLNAATNVEYDVPFLGRDQVHTVEKLARLDYPLTKAGDEEMEIIRCEGHQHIGGLDLIVEDLKTGESICHSTSIYGDGDEIGNENGYLIDMTTTKYSPPRKIKADSKIRIKSEYDASLRHTGVMGIMSVYYVGKRSDIIWPDFQAQPCEPGVEVGVIGAVRALHIVRDNSDTSLFWLGPKGGCVEGLNFRIERFDAENNAWVEVVRDIIDSTYKVDTEGKYAVIAVSGGMESERVAIHVSGPKKGKRRGKGKKKGKGKGKGKTRM